MNPPPSGVLAFNNIRSTWGKQSQVSMDACMEENTPYSNAKGSEILFQEKGGPCPLCGKDFKSVEGKNLDGSSFTYYMPSCRCFWTCRNCGRVMVAEGLIDPQQTWCGNCQSEPTKPAPRKRGVSDRSRNVTGERE